MNLLNLIIRLHNWISDKDFIWWPFSFLRPEPQESITWKLVSLMALCFGGLAFTMFTIFSVVNNVFNATGLISSFFSCFGGFFIWFGFVTKPFWNHRAFALQKKK